MLFLNQRQKILLQNIDKFVKNGQLERTKLVKIMFLLRQEGKYAKDIGAFYSFFPYKYGPFSNNIYYDLGFLARHEFITANQASLTDKGRWIKGTIKESAIGGEIDGLLLRFPEIGKLKSYVYAKYPEYTVKSELIKNKNVDNVNASGIITVGYEGEDIDQFLNKLILSRVTLLIDVRYNPFSMKYAFNKNKLSVYLQKIGIRYLHFPELGIPGNFRKGIESSSDYKSLFQMYKKEILPKSAEKLSEIITMSASDRIALMCFEKDVGRCHRGVISERLRDMGQDVADI